MLNITTRIATLPDLNTIALLFDAYRQFYEQPSDPALAANFINDRIQRKQSVIFLAETDNQQSVGFCQLYPIFCSIAAKPMYSLSDLFVAPAARRTGAGKELLLAAQKYATEQGCCKLELTTANTNRSAQALYESLGWVRDDVFYIYSKHIGTAEHDSRG